MERDDNAGEWFYNVRTGLVEHGRHSDWRDLLGPYASFEEAHRALEIAKERNAAWDGDDAEWNTPAPPPRDEPSDSAGDTAS